jgi:pimeloyl-ACP methyl ester carboxylesterase
MSIRTLASRALSPTLIAGRRCLLIRRGDDDKSPSTTAPAPLVIIGGTAQTIASWEPHIPTLLNKRKNIGDIMIYECIGQGSAPADLSDVTLPAQALQLKQTIDEAFPNAENQQIDFVGYSLGARIAMAYAVQEYPVRKMHLTGVSAATSDTGHVALEAWKDLLHHNNLHGFAWSILQTTYGASFLRKNSHRLATWVQFIVDTNSSQGLLAILEQTRSLEEWTAMAMAERMPPDIDGRIVVGEFDHMAPPNKAQLLADAMGWGKNNVEVMSGCGHAVPTEEPLLWRKHLLDFLDDED